MLTPELAAYLARLGFPEPPPATVETLRALHRAHLATIPYDNLEIMLGRPPTTDVDATVQRIAATGRAGYCFHHNGALGALLAAVGFAVERRHGHVFTALDDRTEPTLNHLVLLVQGLPTAEHPDGRWWPDVGLGDAFLDPLALRAGAHPDGGFGYSLTDLDDGGWCFWHDPAGSFTGVQVSDRPAAVTAAAVAAAHARLATPPDGHFTRLLVAQRRDSAGVTGVRGCVLTRTDGRSRDELDLTSYDAWRGALADEVRLPVADLADDELRALWRRSWAAHRAWDAEGRQTGPTRGATRPERA